MLDDIDKSYQSSGDNSVLALPAINNNKSPFKGFLDISIVTQKLKKSIASEDFRNDMGNGLSSFEFGAPSTTRKLKRSNSRAVKASPMSPRQDVPQQRHSETAIKPIAKGTRFASEDKS